MAWHLKCMNVILIMGSLCITISLLQCNHYYIIGNSIWVNRGMCLITTYVNLSLSEVFAKSSNITTKCYINGAVLMISIQFIVDRARLYHSCQRNLNRKYIFVYIVEYIWQYINPLSIEFEVGTARYRPIFSRRFMVLHEAYGPLIDGKNWFRILRYEPRTRLLWGIYWFWYCSTVIWWFCIKANLTFCISCSSSFLLTSVQWRPLLSWCCSPWRVSLLDRYVLTFLMLIYRLFWNLLLAIRHVKNEHLMSLKKVCTVHVKKYWDTN